MGRVLRSRMVSGSSNPSVEVPSIVSDQGVSSEGNNSGLFGDPNMHECEHCECSFKTRRGLGQHVRRAHPSEKNKEVNVERVKKQWSTEELELLARAEIELVKASQGVIPTLELARALQREFPSRTVEGIRGKQRQAGYKALIAKLTAGNPTLDEITEESSQLSSTGNGLEVTNVMKIKEKIKECVDKLGKNKTRSARMIVSIGKKALSGEIEESMLVNWWNVCYRRRRVTKDPYGGRENVVQGSSKDRKRQLYAMTQKAFKRSMSDAAKLIFDGYNNESKVPTHDDMLGFWERIYNDECEQIELPAEYAGKEYLADIWSPISCEEIEKSKVSSSSAAGCDGVKPRIWNGQNVLIRCLAYNVCLLLGGVPKELSKTRTVFIPKKAEGSDNPGDFRPISIGSVLLRQLNTIFAKRFNRLYAFDQRQSAFMPVDGIGENVTILSTILERAKTKLQELHLCSVDLAKAFDSVVHSALLKVLRQEGFPKPFVKYIYHLYFNARTELQFHGASRIVDIKRGVLQGDPLSPVLFNLVIEQSLKDIPEGIGFTLGDAKINALAYADDTILIASTVEGLQRNINAFIASIGKFGMRANLSKSAALSIVPSGKQKMFKILEVPTFKIKNEFLPQRSIIDNWKHLGVTFAGHSKTPVKNKLMEYINRLNSAPLKPQQRLLLLRLVAIPKVVQALVFGKTSSSGLRSLDLKIRASVRSWLKLPVDCTFSYFYAPIARGGLGLPCLRQYIPVLRLARLNKFRQSDRLVCSAIAEDREILNNIRRCEQALKDLGEIPDLNHYHEHWTRELHGKVDGKDLYEAKNHRSSNDWIGMGGLAMTGGDFVHNHQVRTNSLPSRARCARGRSEKAKECRAGCNALETPYHTIQQCFRTHFVRIKRHDNIVDELHRHFRSKKIMIQKEAIYKTSTGLRKPDLVIKYKGRVHVLDVQVSMGSELQKSYEYKTNKYAQIEGFSDVLKKKWDVDEVVFGACTISYKGIWAKGSIRSLMGLGVPDMLLKQVVRMTLRGSYECWRVFNRSTVVNRR